MGMIIRPIEKNDIPTLAELAAKTYAETFGHSLTPELEETRSEKYFRSVIDTDTILLAIKNGRLAGYIQLSDVKIDVQGATPGLNDQAINAVYIHSDFQGQGIGKVLMDSAFDHPCFRKADNIFIDVWDENERAVQFYLKYGFEVVGKCDVTVDGKIVGRDLVLRRSAKKI